MVNQKDKMIYYDLNKDNSKFLYIDEIQNAIDSLNTVLFMLNKDDKLKWKWIVLCLQHSLYHFCIANLKGTNYTQVLTTKGRTDDDNHYFKRGNEKWKKSQKIDQGKSGAYLIKWIEIDGEPPIKEKKGTNMVKELLIPFWTAFARVQDGEFWMAQFIKPTPLKVDDDSLKSVEELMYYRNKFMHFAPIGTLLNIEKLKNLILPVIDLISFLALDTPLRILYNGEDEKRIKKIISEIKNKII